MSLDELSRKLEGAGNRAGSDDWKGTLGKKFFESIKELDVITDLPDADSFSSVETLLDFIETEFGKDFRSYVDTKLKRFKIDKIPEGRQSRKEVQSILESAERQEKERGKSILDRLNEKF